MCGDELDPFYGTVCTDVYCAAIDGVQRHREGGGRNVAGSRSDENDFSQSDPPPVPPFQWPIKWQVYRANESVDINTVLVDGEEVVNVGFIADGEWLRYTVDITYIGEIENTKGASVEQKTYSSTWTSDPVVCYVCTHAESSSPQPRQEVPRHCPHRNLPAWSVQLARAARFIGGQKLMLYVSMPSFPPP